MTEPGSGEVAEWSIAHAWKACLGESLTRVRIPLSPPGLHRSSSRVHDRPMRETNRLTTKTVASIEEPGLHADGAGLYLRELESFFEGCCDRVAQVERAERERG